MRAEHKSLHPRSPRWLRWLIVLPLVCLLVCGGTLIAMLRVGALAEPQAADVIVVLGARVYPDHLSTALRERLDTALRLYRAGLASQLIVSGGQGADEPTTEARAMRDYLVSRGVDQRVVQMDEQSYSTVANLRNSRLIMQDSGFDTALFVTSDYHLLRVRLIARRLGIVSTFAPAPLPVEASLRNKMLAREVLAVWKDLLLSPWIGH